MPRFDRRWVLMSLFFLCVNFLPVFGACAEQGELIKVYDQPDISSAPYFIAYEEGYFKEEGLRVEFVRGRNYPEGVLMLLQGAVDVIEGPVVAAMFNAVSKGKTLKVVAGSNCYAKGSKFICLAVRKKPGSPEDTASLIRSLKGKKTGVLNPGGFLNWALEGLFEKYGVPFGKDDQVILGSFALVLAALESGSLEAGLLAEPFVVPLKDKKEFALIPISEEFPDMQGSYLSFGPSIILKNPGLGVKFLKAYLRGYKQYLKGKTPRNKEILEKHTGLDEKTIEAMDWPVLKPDAVFETAGLPLKEYQAWLIGKKMVETEVKIEALIDPGFLRKAQ